MTEEERSHRIQLARVYFQDAIIARKSGLYTRCLMLLDKAEEVILDQELIISATSDAAMIRQEVLKMQAIVKQQVRIGHRSTRVFRPA